MCSLARLSTLRIQDFGPTESWSALTTMEACSRWFLPPIFQGLIIILALISSGWLLCVGVFVCGSSGFKNTAWRSRSSDMFQSKLQITFFFLSFTVNMFDAFTSQKPLMTMDENRKALLCGRPLNRDDYIKATVAALSSITPVHAAQSSPFPYERNMRC